jgi:hypothetical protein
MDLTPALQATRTFSIVAIPYHRPGNDCPRCKHRKPHREALAWRFELTQSKWLTKLA